MKTILVVDDEFGLGEALGSILNDEGYRVVLASNGKQGLARIAEQQPDLVMVDFMMPVLNGVEMVQAMRAHPGHNAIPVIMMSGVAESAVQLLCNDYVAFLRKPFSLVTLLEALEHAFNGAVKKGDGGA